MVPSRLSLLIFSRTLPLYAPPVHAPCTHPLCCHSTGTHMEIVCRLRMFALPPQCGAAALILLQRNSWMTFLVHAPALPILRYLMRGAGLVEYTYNLSYLLLLKRPCYNLVSLQFKLCEDECSLLHLMLPFFLWCYSFAAIFKYSLCIKSTVRLTHSLSLPPPCVCVCTCVWLYMCLRIKTRRSADLKTL